MDTPTASGSLPFTSMNQSNGTSLNTFLNVGSFSMDGVGSEPVVQAKLLESPTANLDIINNITERFNEKVKPVGVSSLMEHRFGGIKAPSLSLGTGKSSVALKTLW